MYARRYIGGPRSDAGAAVHAFSRRPIRETFGEETAAALPIQDGGSMRPDSAAELLRQPDVDGVLVGGASLNAEQLLAIVRAAVP